MIKEELYHKTVGILYDAYFNDTLEHRNCYACAVGNLIAANNGYEFTTEHSGLRNFVWRGFAPYGEEWIGRKVAHWYGLVSPFRNCTDKDVALKQILSTGYSIDEIILIEQAFESGDFGESKDEEMFNGLVAVLEVLKEIHQVTDEDLLQANNKRFKDHYAKRVGAV